MKLGKRFFALALSLGISLCAYPAIAGDHAKDASHASHGSSHGSSHGAAHWGYEGENGPEHWGSMKEEFKACSEGKHQSPIDISAAENADIADIGFNYKSSALNILNNGHTVQVNYDKGSSIKVDGVDFQLVQFHFHTPSEHTLNGKSFGNEIHFVHKNDKGELAVVGVLIEKGKENAAFKTVWANLPRKADEKKAVKATINANDMLPQGKSFFRYSGSLTTPPCSENVNWIVLKTPIQMSEKQIKAIESIMKHNNRPVQPVNDRKVTADTVTH
ncbi:MAG: carbonic anhydrase family protein [Deltaproteobacteria bacterium]|nr:carbonic anhydrase family protein [Deltaproteobacteria bacterium]